MCIALLSSAHPSYKLILIDNRDEYLNRPTAAAAWWSPTHPDVLGGRDLQRSEQGTWLGVTRSGKIAVLTNFRENSPPPASLISRGKIIKDFLIDTSPQSTEQYVDSLIKDGAISTVGGFSLVCGQIGEKLAIVSNRSVQDQALPWIMGDAVMTVGLSNAAFTDRGWKKVSKGETAMLSSIQASLAAREDEDRLIHRLLDLLSIDTLPRRPDKEGDLATYITELRNTIFVPPVGLKETPVRSYEIAAANTNEAAQVISDKIDKTTQLGGGGIYGTQKQSILLVDHDWRARFFERTLFDSNSERVPLGAGDVDISFCIQR